MVRLIFHPEAKDELREGAAFYEGKREGLGQEFLTEVRGIAAKIRQNPLRCGFVSPGWGPDSPLTERGADSRLQGTLSRPRSRYRRL